MTRRARRATEDLDTVIVEEDLSVKEIEKETETEKKSEKKKEIEKEIKKEKKKERGKEKETRQVTETTRVLKLAAKLNQFNKRPHQLPLPRQMLNPLPPKPVVAPRHCVTQNVKLLFGID
jgi:hypothetical protein